MNWQWNSIETHHAEKYIPHNGVFWDERQSLWEVRIDREEVTWHRAHELATKYYQLLKAQKGLRRDIPRSVD